MLVLNATTILAFCGKQIENCTQAFSVTFSDLD